jgi:hypothetical protein
MCSIGVNGTKGHIHLPIESPDLYTASIASDCCIARDGAIRECEYTTSGDTATVNRGYIARDGAVDEIESSLALNATTIAGDLRDSGDMISAGNYFVARDRTVGECKCAKTA